MRSTSTPCSTSTSSTSTSSRVLWTAPSRPMCSPYRGVRGDPLGDGDRCGPLRRLPGVHGGMQDREPVAARRLVRPGHRMGGRRVPRRHPQLPAGAVQPLRGRAVRDRLPLGGAQTSRRRHRDRRRGRVHRLAGVHDGLPVRGAPLLRGPRHRLGDGRLRRGRALRPGALCPPAPRARRGLEVHLLRSQDRFRDRERLEVGVHPLATPACVVTCPAECRIFGDLDDPGSNVSQYLAERGPGEALRPDAKTLPNTQYVGLP